MTKRKVVRKKKTALEMVRELVAEIPDGHPAKSHPNPVEAVCQAFPRKARKLLDDIERDDAPGRLADLIRKDRELRRIFVITLERLAAQQEGIALVPKPEGGGQVAQHLGKPVTCALDTEPPATPGEIFCSQAMSKGYRKLSTLEESLEVTREMAESLVLWGRAKRATIPDASPVRIVKGQRVLVSDWLTDAPSRRFTLEAERVADEVTGAMAKLLAQGLSEPPPGWPAAFRKPWKREASRIERRRKLREAIRQNESGNYQDLRAEIAEEPLRAAARVYLEGTGKAWEPVDVTRFLDCLRQGRRRWPGYNGPRTRSPVK